MGASNHVEIGIEFDEQFDKQLDQHEVLFDPVSRLRFRIEETWISGGSAYHEVRAIGFFTQLLTTLLALYEESDNEQIRLFDDTYLAFDRTNGEVTVGHRYTEDAINDPDEVLGIESEAAAPIDTLAEAAVLGAEELLDRVRRDGAPEDDDQLRRLQSTLQRLDRHLE